MSDFFPPRFNSSEEAIAYGRSLDRENYMHLRTYFVTQRYFFGMRQANKRWYGNPSKEDTQRLIDEATQLQFLREAIEAFDQAHR